MRATNHAALHTLVPAALQRLLPLFLFFAIVLILSQLISVNEASAKEVGACQDKPARRLRLDKELPALNPCENRGDSLVAMTDLQLLFLCENSEAKAHYDFALGFGGVDKSTEGDWKTPTGSYSLGRPRASKEFGVFIPIGYPTREQKAQGFTGADVGVHGPKQTFYARCAGVLNVSFNWTRGCLAVADTSFIVEIAKFVQAKHINQIHILK